MDSRYGAGDMLFSSSLLPTPMAKEQLLSLLRSNSLPADRSHFDVVIASSRSEVARYDTAIQPLQVLLDRMIRERAELLHYADGCRSLFSPIRRLPTEIITNIFTLCSPEPVSFYDPEDEDQWDDMLDRSSQLHLRRLSQVSSRWQDIVMQSPQLWTTIAFDCQEENQVALVEGLLSRSLDRSARCPLAIGCVVSSLDAGTIEILVRHCERWRTADIYINPTVADSFLNLKGNVPLLEDLKIGGCGPRPNDIFSSAPKLTHVTLAITAGTVPKLPWSQLRNVDYDFYDGDHPRGRIQSILSVMSACSRECVFNVHRLYLSSLAHHPPLTAVVSEIQALSLSLYDGAQIGELLQALTLPCLRKLTLRSCDSWPRDDFSAFAARSSFHSGLTSLSLYDTVISPDDLVACLSGMNALSELFIEDIVDDGDVENLLVTDSLLQRLAWTAGSSCLAPHLSSMRFASLFTFGSQTLLDFITSRLPSATGGNIPFEVDLTWLAEEEPHIDNSVLAHIVQLCNNGKLRWRFERYDGN
ncbi:hypothetical protein DFH06DRAFT_476749 [Mycena polygramma]|nr:hypothetical protein DFH06DRAFT_476749 [Mycena polygramma]